MLPKRNILATARALAPLVVAAMAPALLLASASVAVAPRAAEAAEVKAKRAYAFVDAVGLNTRFAWPDTPYDGNFTRVAALVDELGVRYVRQRLGNSAKMAADLKELNRLYGVKLLNLMNNKHANGEIDFEAMKRDVAFARDRLGANALLGFEGHNEYSATKYAHNNNDWDDDARRAARLLYNQVKQDPKLSHLQVTSTSIWKRIHRDYVELGDLSSIIDYGNLHYYTQWRPPATRMDEFIRDARIVSGGKRLYVTEWGYAVPESGADADAQEADYTVSGRTAAKYIPRRLALLARDPRVAKMFIHELFKVMPSKTKPNYSLVRSDFTKRPAFYAVRNLLRLLDEPSGAYTPGSLKYRLTASTGDVEQLLLQKKGGTFYLILWRETASWDQATRRDLDPPPASVRLTFEEPINQVQVFRPSAIDVAPDNGLKPRRTLTAPTGVSLDVPDHLVVVKIS